MPQRITLKVFSLIASETMRTGFGSRATIRSARTRMTEEDGERDDGEDPGPPFPLAAQRGGQGFVEVGGVDLRQVAADLRIPCRSR